MTDAPRAIMRMRGANVQALNRRHAFRDSVAIPGVLCSSHLNEGRHGGARIHASHIRLIAMRADPAIDAFVFVRDPFEFERDANPIGSGTVKEAIELHMVACL